MHTHAYVVVVLFFSLFSFLCFVVVRACPLVLFSFIAVYSVCMHERVCTKGHQVLIALHSGKKNAPNKCNYDVKITTLLSGTMFPFSVGSHMLTKGDV